MKSAFSVSWNSSTQVRKQRKYRYNAPLHIRSSFVHVHLDASLRKELGKRAIQVRKGDTIKVLRGSFKGKSGKVERVSLKYSKIYVTGIDLPKGDGLKKLLPLDPTNLMITTLDKSDKNRFNIKEAKNG